LYSFRVGQSQEGSIRECKPWQRLRQAVLLSDEAPMAACCSKAHTVHVRREAAKDKITKLWWQV
jgi:hypothetical protein